MPARILRSYVLDEPYLIKTQMKSRVQNLDGVLRVFGATFNKTIPY
jgi:hypothetical protein